MAPKWGFLTNHALVLLHVAEYPDSTLREIASATGITERAALSILRALEEERMMSREKRGRRNHYRVDVRAVMDCQAQTRYTVEQIVTRMARLAQQLRDEAPRAATAGLARSLGAETPSDAPPALDAPGRSRG